MKNLVIIHLHNITSSLILEICQQKKKLSNIVCIILKILIVKLSFRRF